MRKNLFDVSSTHWVNNKKKGLRGLAVFGPRKNLEASDFKIGTPIEIVRQDGEVISTEVMGAENIDCMCGSNKDLGLLLKGFKKEDKLKGSAVFFNV